MSLDPKDRAALDRLVEDLRSLLGEALQAVLLTGEAASAGYRPRRSPLSTVVVVDDVTPELLRRMRGRMRSWSRKRVPVPLVMDPRYIESSLDVFPLEFLELMDHHRLLHGATDPFAALSIERHHLRLQVEEQLRGKMLHLWGATLAAEDGGGSLRDLLLETPAAFEVALRGLLHLEQPEDGVRPDDPLALLEAVEQRFDVALPTFRRLETLRRDGTAPAKGELERLLDAYLGEVRALVRVIDAR